MKAFIIALAVFFSTGSIFCAATPVWAMHQGFPCYDCHKLLSESRDQFDGSAQASQLANTRVCLTCHGADQDQSGLNPPYVLNKTAPLPAGGSFSPTLFLDNLGHNILSPDENLGFTPPGGDTLPDFGCLSCHDAHDNGNYRNLKREIHGRSTIVQAVGDPDGRRNLYISGMDQFCNACHQQTDPESGAQARAGLPHHPVGVTIYGADNADFRNWMEKPRKLCLVEHPYGNVDDPYNAKVFCLSCHYAHASSFPNALRWDPQSNRGCLECHDSEQE